MSDGWEGILAPGERVIWQGRPARDLRLIVRDPMEFGLGMALTLGPLAPMAILWRGGGSGWAWLVPPLLLGLWCLLGPGLRDCYRRRRTWYSLTDRRAFIATALCGRRKLTARALGWPPRHDGGDPGTLDFAAPGAPPFRFERIADAGSVRDLATAAAGHTRDLPSPASG